MRKIFCNLTVTIISVLVAFVIGGAEILQVLSMELGLSGGFWIWLNGLNFEIIGYGIVTIFVIARDFSSSGDNFLLSPAFRDSAVRSQKWGNSCS